MNGNAARYGVLSDIHGNLFALRAAIERLRTEGVDGWLCAGDVVGYGPHPNECIEAIADLGAVCVAGSHELILLGQLTDRNCVAIARESIRWTRDVIEPDCLAYLESLPRVASVGDVVVTHGSLDHSDEYVTSAEQARSELDQLAEEHPGAGVLVLGHTHDRFLYGHDRGPVEVRDSRPVPLAGAGPYLVNPGAVGQSRELEWRPHARFALLDLEQRQLRFFRQAYDVRATRAAMRAVGLQTRAVHLRQGRLGTLQRRASRVSWEVRKRLR